MAGIRYVVLANDLDELRSAVRLLVGSEPGGAPPLVDAPLLANQNAWAHRRYDVAGTRTPTAAGTMDLSTSATALVVVPDGGSRSVRLRLHGSPGDVAFVTKLNARMASSRFPAFKEAAPGVWESVAAFGGPRDEDGETLLSVLFLLGFGVFL